MHFTNKSKERGKGTGKRVLSVVLSFLMLASMLYVGSVINLEAEAETINSGDTVYVALYNDGGRTDWADDEMGVWTYGGESPGKFYRLTFVQDAMSGGNHNYLLKFNPDENFTKFKVLRIGRGWADKDYASVDRVTEWKYITIPIQDPNQEQSAKPPIEESEEFNTDRYSSSSPCFYFKTSNSDWGSCPQAQPEPLTIKGGNDFNNVGIGYGNETDGYQVGSTKLFPVQAKFYDYLTDYELDYGWRCNNDYEASRTYRHRIPYIRWNKYISDLVGSEGGDWAYPLYFGNITSDWGDPVGGNFDSFPYGTLRDKFVYPANTNSFTGYYNSDTKGHLRHDNLISNYTGNLKLYNFSIYANDSEPIAVLNDQDHNNNGFGYSSSIQGLVKDTLVGNELHMKTKEGSILSPYFSHDSSGGNHNYINTVSTSFPMRINSDNDGEVAGVTSTYTTYEFDSKGKTSGASDNVYFTYSNNQPTAINYARVDGDNSIEVTDAYHSLGGEKNPADHRGFFPFDNGGIGHDYGFGMRLDIPFNLTEDGNVLSVDTNGTYHKTSIPMEFSFEGDDDVWVFVDGKLALDLGGDHGNTKGAINFSLKDTTKDNVAPQTGAPLTGAYVLNSNPQYSSTEYTGKNDETDDSRIGEPTSLAGNFFSSDSYVGTGSSKKYNVTKTHTLTVFYMERGLVESNLRMSFSVSPIANKLTLKKTVNADDVNSNISASDLGISDQSFSFMINPYTASGSSVVYTKNGSDTTTALPSNKTLSLKNNEYAEFDNQFKVNTPIKIKETAKGSGYTYSTSYVLTDDYRAEYESGYSAQTGTGSAIPQFTYKTASAAANAPTLFTAEFINKIETAKVTVSKAYSGTSGQTSFDYGVVVTLPNGTDVTFPDISVAVGGSTDITGIPKGSTVTITEKGASNYNVSYKIGTDGTKTDGNTAAVTDLTEDTTVAFTNEDIPNTPGKYTPKAKKYVSGAAASADQTFSFTLTPWNVSSNSASGTPVTKQNSSGDITFDEITYNSEGTFWYKIEETANEDYTIDTTSQYSNVYYLKCAVNLSNHVYTVTPTYYKSDRTTTVTEANVIFNNIPVIRKGYLKVTKRDSKGDNADFTGTQFTVYKVDGNNEEPDENAEKTVLTLTSSTTFNDVTSKYEAYVASGELDLGWYMVVETKAPNNYELSGEKKWIEVKASNTETSPAEVVFINKPSTDLPTTGGIGVVVFITVGVLLIGAAILLLKPKKAAKK